MDAYWSQYREHCVEQAAKAVAAMESFKRQQTALIAAEGSPVWIAALGRNIAEAMELIGAYEAVVARLDANLQPTG